MDEQTVTLYHNPRCSKSRAALTLLENKGVPVRVVEYLRTPPDVNALRHIVRCLGIAPAELVRTGEDIYREQYKGREMSAEDWLQALATHPVLIERPIALLGERAIIGRPPERVLEIVATGTV